MALRVNHEGISFAIADKVKVFLLIKETGKERTQIFEGIVIAIKNRGENKSFTVRKMGVGGIGIERIFPLFSPLLEKVEVIKRGLRGVKRSKLYYIRGKSPQEIESIFSRAIKRERSKKLTPKK